MRKGKTGKEKKEKDIKREIQGEERLLGIVVVASEPRGSPG